MSCWIIQRACVKIKQRPSQEIEHADQAAESTEACTLFKKPGRTWTLVVLFLVALVLLVWLLLFVLDKATRDQSLGTEEVNMLTWPAVGFD